MIAILGVGVLLFGGDLDLEFVGTACSVDTFQCGIVTVTDEAVHCREITVDIPVLCCQFTLHEADAEGGFEVIVDQGGCAYLCPFLRDLCLIGISESGIMEAP